jgi:hypothetical protein
VDEQWHEVKIARRKETPTSDDSTDSSGSDIDRDSDSSSALKDNHESVRPNAHPERMSYVLAERIKLDFSKSLEQICYFRHEQAEEGEDIECYMSYAHSPGAPATWGSTLTAMVPSGGRRKSEQCPMLLPTAITAPRRLPTTTRLLKHACAVAA